MSVKAIFLASLGSLALMSLASAQTPAQRPRPAQATTPAPAANQVAQPDNTTASYGDWVHRCQQGVGARICEIVQTLQVQGQQGPVALIALGRPIRSEPYKLVTQLPPNVTLASGVRLALGEKDEGVLATFQRCIPGGCFAEFAMTDEVMRRWRGHSEAGQVRYQDAGRRDVALPFSFRGFPAATDALMKD